jgi:hypothetical protein
MIMGREVGRMMRGDEGGRMEAELGRVEGQGGDFERVPDGRRRAELVCKLRPIWMMMIIINVVGSIVVDGQVSGKRVDMIRVRMGGWMVHGKMGAVRMAGRIDKRMSWKIDCWVSRMSSRQISCYICRNIITRHVYFSKRRQVGRDDRRTPSTTTTTANSSSRNRWRGDRSRWRDGWR